MTGQAIEALQGVVAFATVAFFSPVGWAVALIWITATLTLNYRDGPSLARKSLSILLFAPWIALGLWSGFHSRENSDVQTGFHADWFGLTAIIVTVALGVAVGVATPGARAAVAALTLINLWVCIVGTILSVMITTGVWL